MNGVPDLASCTMDPLVEVQLLRIIQEALTNVRKHAGAHSVSIDVTLQNGQARVSLQDDGCGFDPVTTLHGSAGRLGCASCRNAPRKSAATWSCAPNRAR
ncbi:MAG: ATP-binding protein [Caldilineaceae bacterium]